jgi:DNA-binding response OmpR family regulator
MRLLLVDAERGFLDRTARRFKERGVNVLTTTQGEDALDMVVGIGFDVVVLDVDMPGFDGMTLLERIRESSPETRVVLLAGYASTEAAVMGVVHGAFEYMLRPVRFEELYYTVLEAARAAGVPGAGGRP